MDTAPVDAGRCLTEERTKPFEAALSQAYESFTPGRFRKIQKDEGGRATTRNT